MKGFTPMDGTIKEELRATLEEIYAAGLYRTERELTSPQSVHVTTAKAEALNFCANKYLGFANHPTVIEAASNALQEWGFGMASVRFICGTQTLHTSLEARISAFLGTEATILYSSCFDANGGVFEVLFGAEDAIISDELNHASLIDGIRLCKAQRVRYRNADMADLEHQLKEVSDARRKVIVTDGVFSMDGSHAPLDLICDLAEQYGALVMVDDSHAVGIVGEGGRGTHELFDVPEGAGPKATNRQVEHCILLQSPRTWSQLGSWRTSAMWRRTDQPLRPGSRLQRTSVLQSGHAAGIQAAEARGRRCLH